MKTLKKSALLLLVLCCSLFVFSQTAKAQSAAAEGALRRSVEEVRSLAKQQTVKLAKVANEYFIKHPAEIDFKSADFGALVRALVNEKKQLPDERLGGLAKAVDHLQENYQAYTNSITGGQSDEPDQRGNIPDDQTSANGTGSKKQSGNGTQGNRNLVDSESDDTWGIFNYLLAAAGVALALLIAGSQIFSVISLLGLRRAMDEFGGVLPKTLYSVKARQDELTRQIEASAAVSNDTNRRLADMQAEVRQMARMLQQTAASNRQPIPPASYMEPTAARVSDMPVFPIAADELLRQMHRKIMVVKRDFQNDMLISDPDGKGELLLIRDSQIADEIQPLFIVPSVTQFQMRQEYYNFYEKYYDCANPESGAVWIVDPAVVERVAGGWQLREKGRLEVR